MRADASPVVAQLSRLSSDAALHHRRPSSPAPIQRLLAYNGPINTNEISGVRKLDNKVFQLTGLGHERLIIKFEVAADNQTKDEFLSRFENSLDLANQVLQGVPQASPLTQADANQILAMPADRANFDPNDPTHMTERQHRAELKNFIGMFNDPNIRLLILKAEHVNVGANLEQEINRASNTTAPPVGGGGGVTLGGARVQANADKQARTQARTALANTMTTQQMMTGLGRMAAYDMVVNNYDRFRPDMTVNAKNIDYGANTPLGIDNLNPNDQILRDEWEGGQHVLTDMGRRLFADNVVKNLFLTLHLPVQPGANPGYQRYITASRHFKTGMDTALATMKLHVPALTARFNLQPVGMQKVITKRLRERLQRLP